MMMVHPSCDDRDSHEDSSSRIRVADATLRRSSSSDISDSTDGSANISTDKSTQQRRPRRRIRGDFEFRLSATITRTHPTPEPNEESLPSPAATSRSSSPSGDSNGGGTSIRRRKKCQPRHRCAKTNESITSILRPSKYSSSFSSSDDITIDNIHLVSSGEGDSHNNTATIETLATTTKKSSLFQRSSKTSKGLPSASMHSYFLPSLETSTPPLNKSQKLPSCNSLDGQWVPSGVDFSSSVEVHVFYK